jgi:hypothetical protein
MRFTLADADLERVTGIGRVTPSQRRVPVLATALPADGGHQVNSFQCPSDTTSTVSSVTLMAVWSSMA